MNKVKEVNHSNFDSEVLKSDVPVLVDFFAPWCGPCRALAPVLESVAASYGDKLKVVKVNVDVNQDLAEKYEIRGVPTLMIFRDGELVDLMVGMPPASMLKQKLDSATASGLHAVA